MNNILKISIGVLLVLQYSCNNSDSNSKTSSTAPIKIENQGVNIEYSDSKIGDTVLLFIHGWAIDQSYWADQVAFFSKKYRVVTLDLPGFGKSGKNRASWTVEDYGKDLSALLTGLDLKNVVLIGHSMSGAIAVETALTNPTRVIGVIGVDNFKKYGVVETPESKASAAEVYNALRTHYKSTLTGYINQYLFSPSTDSLTRLRILNDMTGADSILAVDCIEKNDQYPLDEKLKSWKKPLYTINSDLWPNDTASFRNNNIDYVLFNIGPTGHYPMIEKPNEFNALLQQAMSKINK
ncbi:MAG: alpha/beta hydrolase [Phycisphaerae bacterium]|nr:alpha/beta hydrolase [Saprospiraceae bacterium]